jgi:hypothetical protein
MRKFIINSLLFALVSLSVFSCAVSNQAQRIISKDKYYHKATGISFPTKMFEYSRTEIYSFDEQRNNISVTYTDSDPTGKTYTTLYLYPAGIATESRLRNEYEASLNEIGNLQNSNFSEFAISHTKEGYQVNGIKIQINNVDQSNSTLSVFECGKWFFKIRTTSNRKSFENLAKLEQRILDLFEPTELVKTSPIIPEPKIYVAPAAFSDSVILGSATGSALRKLIWVKENVDSLELLSGFPDLYLDLHKSALLEFVKFEQENSNYSKTESTEFYLTQLNMIINSGFLSEFILDQFNMIMFIPEEVEANLDFESYNIWRRENSISIDLRGKFYIISY